MDKLTVRRKLLRGSLSAPVVLTVSSASAQTVTSLGLCIARNANSQPTTTYSSGKTDGWFRVGVKVYGIYQGSPSSNKLQGYFFKDGSLYRSVNSPYGLWNGTGTVSSPYQVDAGHDWWQLVWFDSSGHQVGAGFQKPGNSLAATMSCQLSFG